MTIPASLAGVGTRYLVFTWRNDGSVGAGPAAAIDNVSLISNVPAPLSGTKTIPGDYSSIGHAFANLNAHGANTAGGSLTFNVAAGTIFTESPGPLQVSGSSASNRIIFQKSGVGANPKVLAEGSGDWGLPSTGSVTSTHGIIALNTADFITFDGIDVQSNNVLVVAPWTAIEYGYVLRNARNLANVTTIDGAQNNIIKNMTVTLDRRKVANNPTVGILQTTTTGGGSTPTSAAQANSGNVYMDVTIRNAYRGIELLGNATWPDVACQITTSACGTYNSIGDPAVVNDIGGGGTSAAFGINLSNQSGFFCQNNRVSNVGASAIQVSGINVIAYQGIPFLNNNHIRGIRATSTTSTTAIDGIRDELRYSCWIAPDVLLQQRGLRHHQRVHGSRYGDPPAERDQCVDRWRCPQLL